MKQKMQPLCKSKGIVFKFSKLIKGFAYKKSLKSLDNIKNQNFWLLLKTSCSNYVLLSIQIGFNRKCKNLMNSPELYLDWARLVENFLPGLNGVAYLAQSKEINFAS